METLLRFDISAEERDAAWQSIQEAESEAPETITKETAPAKKTGPLTLADVVKTKRAQGMKI